MKTFQIKDQKLREELEEVRSALEARTTLYPSGKHTVAKAVEIADDEGQVYRLETSMWAFFVPTKSRLSNQPKRDEAGRVVYDYSTMYVAVDSLGSQMCVMFASDAVIVKVKSQERTPAKRVAHGKSLSMSSYAGAN